jgi:hypothetical protein
MTLTDASSTLLVSDDPPTGETQRLLTVSSLFAGPAGTVHAGWIAGTVARALGSSGVEVTIRVPAPLDMPLILQTDGGRARLLDGDRVLAEARRADASPLPPSPVGFAEAAVGESRFPGHRSHPFPGCFACGPEREAGDGLRIFPGPTPGQPDTAACWWTAPGDLVDGAGEVLPEVVWAALDCATVWAGSQPRRPVPLSRLTVVQPQPVFAGQTYVVVAEPTGSRPGERSSRAGIYDADHRLVATAAAVRLTPAD